MTNYKKQILSVVAAGTMLLNLAAPALADTTITISGNGAGSNNAVVATQTNTNTVTQSNTANVENNVTTNANTGNNDANFNTGGNVTVSTGNASTTANVTNTLNSNAAEVAGCNCGSDTKVDISGNGALSNNLATVSSSNANTVTQTNKAEVENEVNTSAKTGGNDANKNTGGDVTVVTGNATSNANVSTTVNSNSAVIGSGAGAGSTASFVITGNGAGSNNWITAVLSNANKVTQNNSAEVENDVTSKAKTGYNDANFNTGGDVIIATGNAKANANVDNMVNFNSASVDCGCTFDVLAKIAGNGAGFQNDPKDPNGILLTLSNANVLGQTNHADLENEVYAKAKTGGNDALSNTGAVSGNDPIVVTGDASNTSNVNNAGNVNTVGGDNPLVISLPGGSSVSLSFDIQALLALFGLSIN